MYKEFGLPMLLSGLLAGMLLLPQGYADNVVNINNRVASGGSLTLANQSLDAISVGHSLTLTQSEVHGDVAAGHQINCTDCKIEGNISAGHGLTLKGTTIEGNASVGSNATIENSTIGGTLSTGSSNLKLDNATIGAIRISASGFSSGNANITIRRNSIVGNNNISIHNGVMTGSSNGQSVIAMGNQGVSTINGYTVKTGNGVTTVMTPDNVVFQNGKRVSGSGPATYDAYQKQHPEAPMVHGPGWASSKNSDEKGVKAAVASQIELTNKSIVKGDIIFEGGNGKVLLHPGSSFEGKLIGGKIENLK